MGRRHTLPTAAAPANHDQRAFLTHLVAFLKVSDSLKPMVAVWQRLPACERAGERDRGNRGGSGE